jgi:integrase
MSIKEIEKGKRYLVRVPVGYSATGVVRHHNKTVRGTLTDARKYERDRLAERDKGLPVTASALTVGQLLDRWLRNLEAKGRARPRTLEAFTSQMNACVRPSLGRVKLSSLKPFHVEAMLDELKARKLSPNTVRRVFANLRAALRQGVRWQLIHYDPTDAVVAPKSVKPRTRAFTADEARLIADNWRLSRKGLIFLFALSTGMRPEEYLALPWRSLDLEACRAEVTRAVQYLSRTPVGGESWYFDEPKTKNGRRTVQFPAWLSPLLAEHRARQLEESMKLRKFYRADLDLVFGGRWGQPLKIGDLTAGYLRPLCEAVGIEGRVTLYTLRHTYATLLLADGENPKTVSRNMGHASVAFTLDTYCAVLPQMEERSAERMGRLLAAK